MPLPDFPQPPRNPAAPGGPVPNRKGVLLAGLLGISVSGAVALGSDISSNESGGKVYLSSYQDRVGVWTIGDGLIRYPDGRPVKRGDQITQDQADEYREREIVVHAKPIIRCIPGLYARENQVRAIVDLSYNVGPGGICTGSVGKAIRAGDWTGAQQAIGAYVYGSYARPQRGLQCHPKKAGGFACLIPGLQRRREREQARFAIDRPSQGAK